MNETAPKTGWQHWVERIVNVDAPVTQVLIYGASFIAGMQLALLHKPPQALAHNLGTIATVAWVTLAIVAPVVIIGTAPFPGSYRANYLSLAGSVGMLTVFAVYALALIESAFRGQVGYAVYIFVGLALLSLVFAVRDFVRIRQNNRIARALRAHRELEALRGVVR